MDAKGRSTHVAFDGLTVALNDWFEGAKRPFPWRDEVTSAWGILVSEFMSQQTQIERVVPKWLEWMSRWPRPSDLANDAPGEAVIAWDRLGYPRRALWLHRAAAVIAKEHGDEVPRDLDALLALPGVGPYTARAVAAFAFGDRHPVVDTNTRRVLARVMHGRAQAGMPAPRDLDDLLDILPEDRKQAATFNAAIMELGAIVCTARTPKCDACPIQKWCAWRAEGYPDNAPEKRPKQASFSGSDRQVRGRIMAAVRKRPGGVPLGEALNAARAGELRDADQPERALNSLIADGLLVSSGNAKNPGVSLPGS